MDDLISRQAAIEAIEEYADRLQMVDWKENPGVPYKAYALNWCINTIRDLPSAQPEIKPIEYLDCANAMLRMWMDNVVTDGEYNRIMDKLNAHYRKEKCSMTPMLKHRSFRREKNYERI